MKQPEPLRQGRAILCPKCPEAPVVSIRYLKDGEYGERLSCVCNVCGYRWHAPCADAGQDGKEPGRSRRVPQTKAASLRTGAPL